jgi:hypothetical protein
MNRARVASVKLGIWISNTKSKRAKLTPTNSPPSPNSDSTGHEPGVEGAACRMPADRPSVLHIGAAHRWATASEGSAVRRMTGMLRPATIDDGSSPPGPGAYPGQGRTGQRISLAVAFLVMPVMVVVPAILARVGITSDGVCIVAFFSPMLTMLARSIALSTRYPELGGDLLTTRTWTGRRTLDLTRLRSVKRKVVSGGRGSATRDWYFLTDTHGVRLRLDKLHGSEHQLDQAVRAAIRPDTDVSPNAFARLGMTTTGQGHRAGPHNSCLTTLATGLAFAVLTWGLPVLSYLLAIG